MRTPRHPIGTVDDQIGLHFIVLHCDACLHHQRFDPSDLAERVGAALSLRRLVARSICRECGGRKVSLSIVPPTRSDRTDRPRQRLEKPTNSQAPSAG